MSVHPRVPPTGTEMEAPISEEEGGVPAVAVARASAAEGSTQDSSSRSASFESEGGTPRTPATVWSVWSSGPLARHFLREWAKEFAASFKGRSSVTAIVSKAILKLSDDGAAPEAPVEPMVAASASAFLRSRHGSIAALTAACSSLQAPLSSHARNPLPWNQDLGYFGPDTYLWMDAPPKSKKSDC